MTRAEPPENRPQGESPHATTDRTCESAPLHYARRLSDFCSLTTGAAHEVKNSLNALRLHLELLKTRLAGNQPEAAKYAAAITEDIQRLDRTLQGLLTFMKPQDLNPRPVDLNALLTEVVQHTRAEAKQNGVEIVLDPAPDLPWTEGDPELLREACDQLLMNAVQAVTAGDVVTVTTRLPSPTEIEISVADRGSGIPQEDLEKVFRLFYTTKPGAPGIGLSLAYKIFHLHGGHIDLRSQEGNGTVVTLLLPTRL